MKVDEEKLLKDITKLLKSWRISGILHIPGIGVKSLYKDEAVRLRILDYALVELECDRIFREKIAESHANEEIAKSGIRELEEAKLNNPSKPPSYVG